MSGLTLYFTQEEASVRAIAAGRRFALEPPADPDAALRGVRAAVKERKVSETTHRRIHAQGFGSEIRSWPRAETHHAAGGNRLTWWRERRRWNSPTRSLSRTITLVRDDRGSSLPLKPAAQRAHSQPRDRRTEMIGRSSRSRFAGAMTRAGRKMDTIVLDDRSSEAEVNKALDLAGRANLVIASMYGRVCAAAQARSVGLPQPGARALEKLIESPDTDHRISFGNPYVLLSFPKLRTYIVAYGDMPSLQGSHRTRGAGPDRYRRVACRFRCRVCILAAREFGWFRTDLRGIIESGQTTCSTFRLIGQPMAITSARLIRPV